MILGVPLLKHFRVVEFCQQCRSWWGGLSTLFAFYCSKNRNKCKKMETNVRLGVCTFRSWFTPFEVALRPFSHVMAHIFYIALPLFGWWETEFHFLNISIHTLKHAEKKYHNLPNFVSYTWSCNIFRSLRQINVHFLWTIFHQKRLCYTILHQRMSLKDTNYHTSLIVEVTGYLVIKLPNIQWLQQLNLYSETVNSCIVNHSLHRHTVFE